MIPFTDVSVWQDNNTTPQGIDFTRMRSQGVVGVSIRAAFGATIDEDFRANWKAAREAGMRRFAYFFWDYRPGAPKASKQIDFWMNLLSDDPGELPPALDFEQPNGSWPELPSTAVCYDAVWNYFTALDKKLSLPRGTFYSNPASILGRLVSLIDGKYSVQPWLKAHYLWIAHWYVPKPNILCGWDDFTFWQYALGKGKGPAHGVESLDIDLDYFNGTMTDLDRVCNRAVPEPPKVLTLEERISRIEKALIEKGILYV